MKKMLAGGLALGFVGVGTALVAAPGGAQEEFPGFIIENLDATLTPTTVAGGGTVTVTSDDPCPTDVVGVPITQVAWGYAEPGWLDTETLEGEVIDQGTAPLNEDGSWTVTFQATTAPGTYDFFALCAPPDVTVDEDALAEATVLGDDGHGDDGHGDEGDEGGEPCPPEPEVTPLGGDTSTTVTVPCDTTPSTEPTTPSTEPTMPPMEDITLSLYGPLTFTVTAGAAPVEGPPQVTG